MKNIRGQIGLGLILISLSALFYSIHYAIFKDANHIFLYLIGDIAFLPIEVLIVTLIINSLLQQREKDILMQKMNMVIGTFFSEVGNELLEHFLRFNSHSLRGNEHLIVAAEWSEKDFNEAVKFITAHQSHVDIQKGSLNELKDFLQERRLFLLRLLENQNLLEHDSFTDLLWAVFHLSEELDARQDISQLTEMDGKHLELDINRAYNHLLFEWLMYMKHMKKSYPYLFSLAVRTNIFRNDPSPEVK